MFALTGKIFITDKIEVVNNFPITPMSRIINLDEDDVLPKETPYIISGQCLLPPIESKIAEADGNEAAYDEHYRKVLTNQYNQTFMAALISFLYKGGNLLLFLPELGYSLTCDKLIEHVLRIYGIQIGKIGYESNEYHKITESELHCFYDANYTPMWLDMVYLSGVISPYEYLLEYPIGLRLGNGNPEIMEKLIADLLPVGYTLIEKESSINFLRERLHYNPRSRSPFISAF